MPKAQVLRLEYRFAKSQVASVKASLADALFYEGARSFNVVRIDKLSSQLDAAERRLQTLVEETNVDEFDQKEEGKAEEGKE